MVPLLNHHLPIASVRLQGCNSRSDPDGVFALALKDMGRHLV